MTLFGTWKLQWRVDPFLCDGRRFRLERFGNRFDCGHGTELGIGRFAIWCERVRGPWWEDARVLGYRFDLDRWPTPWQRGFWIDRRERGRVVVGLGAAILYVERMR